MGPSERGSSLVEVIVAILLIALMTAPLMSTALTGRMSMGRADRQIAAAAAVRALSEQLKAYVAADLSLATGPGTGASGWLLPGDQSGMTALQAGHHDLAASRWLSALAPYGGTISYDVTSVPTPSGPRADVTFNVAWKEP